MGYFSVDPALTEPVILKQAAPHDADGVVRFPKH
jgi:hypothetical protein